MDDGLRLAIKAVGTRYELAKRLGLTAVAVYRWKRVPSARLIEVERITGVPREKLRPELAQLWASRPKRRLTA